MKFSDIKGQEFAINILKNSIKEKRITNFYIFYGEEGIGKKTTALAFTKALNCKNLSDYDACDKCIICKRIDNDTFLDVKVIKPQGMYIKIEQVREIIKDINLRPYESKWKIYIICDAHRMRTEAANSFLKILEEPPLYGILIFITTHPESLPQTILSRAQKIKFNLLTPKDIKLILDNKKIEYNKILPFICMGKVNEVINKNIELINKRDKLFNLFLNFFQEDILASLKLAEKFIELSKEYYEDKIEREAIASILDLFLILIRDMILFKIDPKLVINYDKIDEIKLLTDYFSINNLIEIIYLIRETKSYILRNANSYLALIVLFIKIYEKSCWG